MAGGASSHSVPFAEVGLVRIVTGYPWQTRSFVRERPFAAGLQCERPIESPAARMNNWY